MIVSKEQKFYLKRLRQTGLEQAAKAVEAYIADAPESVLSAWSEFDRRYECMSKLVAKAPNTLSADDQQVIEQWFDWFRDQQPPLLEYHAGVARKMNAFEITLNAASSIVTEATRKGIQLPELYLENWRAIIARFRFQTRALGFEATK